MQSDIRIIIRKMIEENFTSTYAPQQNLDREISIFPKDAAFGEETQETIKDFNDNINRDLIIKKPESLFPLPGVPAANDGLTSG